MYLKHLSVLLLSTTLFFLTISCSEEGKSNIIILNPEPVDSFSVKLLGQSGEYMLGVSTIHRSRLYMLNYAQARIESYFLEQGKWIFLDSLKFEDNAGVYSFSCYKDEILFLKQDLGTICTTDLNLKRTAIFPLKYVICNDLKLFPYSSYETAKPMRLNTKMIVMPLDLHEEKFLDFDTNTNSRKIKFNLPPLAIFKQSNEGLFVEKTIGEYTSKIENNYLYSEIFQFDILNEKIVYSSSVSRNIYITSLSAQKDIKKINLETSYFENDNFLLMDSLKAKEYAYSYNYEIVAPQYSWIRILSDDSLLRLYIAEQSLKNNENVNDFFDKNFSLIIKNKQINTEFVFEKNSHSFESIILEGNFVHIINDELCTDSTLQFSSFHFF